MGLSQCLESRGEKPPDEGSGSSPASYFRLQPVNPVLFLTEPGTHLRVPLKTLFQANALKNRNGQEIKPTHHPDFGNSIIRNNTQVFPFLPSALCDSDTLDPSTVIRGSFQEQWCILLVSRAPI